MQLSLARWSKEGSTEGAWVVREIPGVVIMSRINQGGTMWAILPVAGQIEQLSEIWGDGWQCSPETRKAMQKAGLFHPTRGEALRALEAVVSKTEESSLKAILDQAQQGELGGLD